MGFTKTELVKEIIRCGRDPVYFINNYAKIQHPVKGLVPFSLHPFQEDIIAAYTQHRQNIILKARQLGVTTVSGAYIAWLMLFHRDKNILIVATKQETSKNMIRVVRNILNHVPAWMKDVSKIKIDNRHSIELENGSRVKASSTSRDVGRSEALSLLVVDEAAHIQNFSEVWAGLYPAISQGGSVVLCSSPLGTGNFFHKCFEMARNGENGFNCFFGNYVNPNDSQEIYNDRFPWWVFPEHDLAWFQAETFGKNPREIAQEYLCSFVSSGDTFIWHEDIARIERNIKDPIKVFQDDRSVWIWEEPNPQGTYLIAADISRGDAQDYSAFHVLRLDGHPLVQVCEYRGKIKPDELGILLVKVSQYYNNAMIAPENNSGWSGQTILKIEEANYPFIYYTKRNRNWLRNRNDNSYVDPRFAGNKEDFAPGYSVTAQNRTEMLAKMEQYVRLGDIKINSRRLVEEFKTFIVNASNKPEASRGYPDDLVMALAGALWIREESFFMRTSRKDDLSAALINSMSTSIVSTRNFRDFDFQNSDIANRGTIVDYKADQYKIYTANNDEIDISWLLSKG